MFPDFSYILHYIFGTEPDNAFSVIKTFGLFLGLAFVASGYLLYLELKRKESLGQLKGRMERVLVFKPLDWKDIVIHSLIYFVLTFKLVYAVQHFEMFKKDPAAIIFSLKGNLLWGSVGGSIALVYYIYKRRRQTNAKEIYSDMFIHPHQRVVDITGVAAIWGIIGSKLFSVLENFSSFIEDPIGEFFSGSGLTIYGGLILAFVMVYRYVERKGLRPIHMMDAIAPTLMIGYCVGRMGCHFSGDGDWGIVNEMAKPSWFAFPDSWWSYHYPHNVLNEGIPIVGCNYNYCKQLVPGVFPTPLYEVILAGLITAVLWILRKFILRAGVLFFLYCFLNGLERFFIEFIRVNPRYSILGLELSQAQYIAGALILVGLIGMVHFYKRNIR